MITRIVKLYVDPAKVSNFIRIYQDSKAFIKNSEGNISVQLVGDIHQKNILFTISEWTSEEALNNYRSSEFFGIVWAQVKPLLIAKTEAHSLATINESK